MTRGSPPASCTPGLDPDPAFGGVVPPIHQASTYVQKAPGEFVGDYDYSRSANPTRTQLEKALGELEGGRGTAFSSGMAATHALITAVATAGAHAIIPSDLYGGTYRLVDKVLSRWGLEYTMVDQSDLDAVAAAVRPETKLIWVETPTNPSLNVVDVEGDRRAQGRRLRGGRQHVRHARLPAAAGARRRRRRALHDQVHGRALRRRRRRRGRARRARPRGHEVRAELRRRGARALRLLPRAPRHAHAAPADGGAHRERAGGLGVAPRGAGRERRPLAGLRRMVCFRHDDATGIASRTSVFSLAESLGGVESLLEVPQAMTHQSVEDSDAAVPADLVRLSCGIEDPADLVADLAQAMGLPVPA